MALTIVYRHDHECSHKDETVEDRPNSRNGVAWFVVPTCEETMTELALVSILRY